jgi:hypothetical protein
MNPLDTPRWGDFFTQMLINFGQTFACLHAASWPQAQIMDCPRGERIRRKARDLAVAPLCVLWTAMNVDSSIWGSHSGGYEEFPPFGMDGF